MLLLLYCALFLSGHLPTASSVHWGLGYNRQSPLQVPNPTGPQEVFQVYHPVSFTSKESHGCNTEILLMEHVFGASYGKPFVGNYQPPGCEFDTVGINLTVTSRGRQFDRLALMYLGDTEVFRTSTAEPMAEGIEPQKLIFDLGNLISDIYTGSFNVTLTAHFSYQENARTADIILPISAANSLSNSPSAFHVPGDNTTVQHRIPAAVSRAIVSISAWGQSQEEFWWSNGFSPDTEDFKSTVGELSGFSPFREIQLYIDGILAGVIWPFPVIFTGGVAPGFWRPIVGIDSFDLRQPEIDISPFLPLLQDGQEHSFEIHVRGLDITAGGIATLSDAVGSYWVITGNIFLFIDDKDSPAPLVMNRESEAPRVNAPTPRFTITRSLVQNQTGGNESLAYCVVAERSFSASSPRLSWSQTLSFANHGIFNQQGCSQVNQQHTSGNFSTVELEDNSISTSTLFEYPLVVSSTYGTTGNELTIDAWMERGLYIEATGGPGISTYTLTSGPSQLRSSQSGTAHYQSVNGGNSSSQGDTMHDFESLRNGKLYKRSVRAVNGGMAYDSDPNSKTMGSPSHGLDGLGRDSVRSMLGRGPRHLS
ncbi:hypothetical protein NUU61_008927 [Penicillium alfredii]|uniref:Peptide N-acetyl-beta-D-glucosaminyl asparaginase amidase A N-terminal domain-containing protein n=1 Tax=Penicillium alfredii TaxID=1506179 RepID=A0A9W9EM27_9EURO|nr:uncharacterized protein NUU61_008927 [Penicillium alfredii]KAJ5084348.1 hypothetical protein NUU61_008927 [Penicillium alfredii]